MSALEQDLSMLGSPSHTEKTVKHYLLTLISHLRAAKKADLLTTKTKDQKRFLQS